MQQKHKWQYGQWQNINDLYLKDDVCECGCIRHTMLINDWADEWTIGYTYGKDAGDRAPICFRESVLFEEKM